MLYFERGSTTDKLDHAALRAGLFEALKRLGTRNRVLVVPPDVTRFHSHAGELTTLAHEFYGEKLVDVPSDRELAGKRIDSSAGVQP